MPSNSNEEALPPGGEAAPAPVSTLADSVAEVNDQLASAKLSDQDEAKPPADAAAGDTNTVRGKTPNCEAPSTEGGVSCLSGSFASEKFTIYILVLLRKNDLQCLP